MTGSFKARNTSKKILILCGDMCSALTNHCDHDAYDGDGDENLRVEPKETRRAPLSVESRKVCRFEGSGRAGLRCRPPTFKGNQKKIGICDQQ